MAGSIHAIEFTTSRIAEVEAIVAARRGESGGTLVHGTITARLNQPGTYLTIVESAESGSGSDQDSTAARLIAELAPLCDERPTFYALRAGSVPHPRSPDQT